ncbi:hypothetical protein [Vallitalea maricola]|uniref:Uncharacterized protein n=1 Tax=Vallitalea maricola TaxID=3074433 RepID=A0ACB5UJV4_9FIRM|nr:hypothetical protein AN2V17_20450 [Vallitalea sp. AN17-2]
MKLISNADILPQKTSKLMLHCKIVTIYHYLLLNNIEIDYWLLYLLGVRDLLQFGVQKYNETYLWFLYPYNIYSEKELMNVFNIELVKSNMDEINRIKECIDNDEILAIYYDGNIYVNHSENVTGKKLDKDYYNKSVANSFINNSSFGLIIGYDDRKQCFILNIIDIDGTNICIGYNKFFENNLFLEMYFMKLDQSYEATDFDYLGLQRLHNESEKYLIKHDSYLIDEEKQVCEIKGCSSLLALKQELLQSIELFKKYENNQIITKRFSKRLDIMRLFLLKGSNTGFRKELSFSLDYLGKVYDKNSLKQDAAKIAGVGKYWREFTRYLYNVNSKNYNQNPVKYIKGLIKIIDELYINEGQVFLSIKSNTESILN